MKKFIKMFSLGTNIIIALNLVIYIVSFAVAFLGLVDGFYYIFLFFFFQWILALLLTIFFLVDTYRGIKQKGKKCFIGGLCLLGILLAFIICNVYALGEAANGFYWSNFYGIFHYIVLVILFCIVSVGAFLSRKQHKYLAALLIIVGTCCVLGVAGYLIYAIIYVFFHLY